MTFVGGSWSVFGIDERTIVNYYSTRIPHGAAYIANNANGWVTVFDIEFDFQCSSVDIIAQRARDLLESPLQPHLAWFNSGYASCSWCSTSQGLLTHRVALFPPLANDISGVEFSDPCNYLTRINDALRDSHFASFSPRRLSVSSEERECANWKCLELMGEIGLKPLPFVYSQLFRDELMGADKVSLDSWVHVWPQSCEGVRVS